MRLSKQTNYAVRTLIYCASNPEGLSRVPQIAKAFGISDMFLFKIIQPLTRTGLIETVRGRNGGIRLGRPADEIRLGEVMHATEDGFDLSECQTHEREQCPLRDICIYTKALDKALAAFMAAVNEYTIADLQNVAGVRAALGIDRLRRPEPRPESLLF